MQQKIFIKSAQERQLIDLTSLLADLIVKNSYHDGILFLFTTNTACSLTVIESSQNEAGIFGLNVDKFALSSIVGTSLTIPVESSSMVLGASQKVVLVEASGPNERQVIINFSSHSSGQLP